MFKYNLSDLRAGDILRRAGKTFVQSFIATWGTLQVDFMSGDVNELFTALVVSTAAGLTSIVQNATVSPETGIRAARDENSASDFEVGERFENI